MIISKLIHNKYNKHYIKQFKACGEQLRFHPEDSLIEYRHTTIGDRVFINRRVYLSAPNGQINIGNDVLIGADVFIAAGNHNYTIVGETINCQGYPSEEEKVDIKDDVWIASKVIILGNVTVFEGAVIGAGSLVLKDIPPYCLCVGNPNCRAVKYRYSDGELKQHFVLLGKDAEEAERVITLRRKMTEGIISL